MKKDVLIKNPTAPRINFLDFIKGIAIICVIIGHGEQETSLQNLFIFIFSFHMPIFFIISGFLFADGNSIKLSFGEIAYKRFRSLILPYLITGLICFLVEIFIYLYNSTDYSYTFLLYGGKNFLQSLCYGAGKEVILLDTVFMTVGNAWFLPSLFSAIIIFYFFLKLFEKYSIVIQSIIIILLTYAGSMIGQYIYLPWSIDISLVSQIFVFSGYLMRKYKIFEKKTPIWLFIAAASIWLLDLYMGGISMNERIYNYPAVSTIGAIAASYLLMKLSYFLSNSTSFYYKSISYIGRQSLVILCFSLLDLRFGAFFPYLISFFAWLYQNNHWIILTVTRLCYSLLIAEIIKLLPFLKLVYYPRTSRIRDERLS
jgi:fucose 4-O-acetylase-like acetyltransferase